MKIEDIKTVFELAKDAHDGSRVWNEIGGRDLHEAQGRSIAAVETWLRSVGALTATVSKKRMKDEYRGAKVLDARSRAAGKAGTKRRQRA